MGAPKRKAKPSNAAAAKPKRPRKDPSVKKKSREYISVPNVSDNSDDDLDIAEQDVDLDAAKFLLNLDSKGISKSRKIIQQEHKKSKPAPAPRQVYKDTAEPVSAFPEEEEVPVGDLDEDDLAFGSGDSDDELSVMSDLSAGEFSDTETLTDSQLDEDELDEEDFSDFESLESNSDIERDYQENRQRHSSESGDEQHIQRLPVQLENGNIKHSADPLIRKLPKHKIEEDPEELEERRRKSKPAVNPLGQRFGRPALQSILEQEDKKLRIAEAREEIANLARECISQPDLSLNQLRRLMTFCLPAFPSTDIKIDPAIRTLALLSLLAVFLDIIPGYRIRPLTDQEKSTKVSQLVARQRDFEDSLVGNFKRYLETCEQEVKANSVIRPVAIKCMCELVTQKTHFNYAINIMDVLAHAISRVSDWDSSCDEAIKAITTVFSNDVSGENSLHIVRVLSRTIKTRSFNVHPAFVSCLLSLRLKQDLAGVRASHEKSERDSKGPKKYGKGKGKVFMNKKAKKALKERKEIEAEIEDAEVTIKDEDKARFQTETLKLVFALYFRILKLPDRSPLLPATLEGLSRFSHLVNVDFFRDLLAVLKGLVILPDAATNTTSATTVSVMKDSQLRDSLHCIVTAFELLSGQGSALNIDLTEFIINLYTLIGPLALSPTLEQLHENGRATEADLLFRALKSVFLSRRTRNPPTRTMSFAKRVLLAALQWPPTSAVRALQFVKQLVVIEPQLEMMLESNEGDRRLDGVYRYDIEDPGLCNPEATIWWELEALRTRHWAEVVREAADELANYIKGNA